MPPATSSGSTDDLGSAARRGLLYITCAKLWFMIAGLLMQLLLPRAFGSPALFGVWTLVLGWVSAFNNVIITATIQTVSHFAAAGAAQVEQAKRTALRLQVLVGGGVALLVFLLAPLIGRFEHDAELVPHLRLASAIVLSYSFYAVFVGAANGARHFHKQAGLDMSFSTLRAVLVIAMAALFHSTLHAVIGFVAAAAFIVMAAVVVVGLPRPAGGEPVRGETMLRFGGWLIVYLGATNVLLFLDGWWLKRLCAEFHAGLPDAKHTVDALVGVYGAAQTVSRLPYQLILAGAFVVFPVMSAAAVSLDRERTRRYIAATLRYAFIAVVALGVALGGRPDATMRLLYPSEYVSGAGALAVLLASYLCISLFAIVGTILNGTGRTIPTSAIGVVTVLLTTLAVRASIAWGLRAGDPLLHAALGMLIGTSAGLIISLGYLWHTLRATLSPLSLLRCVLGAGLALGLSRLWPQAGSPGLLGSKLGTLLCAGLSAALFLGSLLVMREISLSEVLALRKDRPRGQASGVD